MATPGMLATLVVTGKQIDPTDATKTVDTPFYFLGAKELYTDSAMSTATGIKDVTATHRSEVVLTEVGDLLLHGILRTVEVEINTGNSLVIRKVRYAGAKSATIETDLIGKSWTGVGVLKGKPIKAIVESRRKITE
jgi:hypothetical protein